MQSSISGRSCLTHSWVFFGAYVGHPLDECCLLSRRILDTWAGCHENSSMYRVALKFFSNAPLAAQLEQFSKGGKQLRDLPDLSDLTLR